MNPVMGSFVFITRPPGQGLAPQPSHWSQPHWAPPESGYCREPLPVRGLAAHGTTPVYLCLWYDATKYFWSVRNEQQQEHLSDAVLQG